MLLKLSPWAPAQESGNLCVDLQPPIRQGAPRERATLIAAEEEAPAAAPALEVVVSPPPAAHRPSSAARLDLAATPSGPYMCILVSSYLCIVFLP